MVQMARELCTHKYRRRIDDGRPEILGLFAEREPYVCLRVVNFYARRRTVTYLALREETAGRKRRVWVMDRPPNWGAWKPDRFMCDKPKAAMRLLQTKKKSDANSKSTRTKK